jgi:hypothetical protein
MRREASRGGSLVAAVQQNWVKGGRGGGVGGGLQSGAVDGVGGGVFD